MTLRPLIPVILCGGKGTRLWPLSRASYPKQYWALGGMEGETLLQQTQKRLIGLKGLTDPIVICHEDHRFIVAEQMRQIETVPKTILLEPIGRNTAPAIAVAALQATARGNDPLLLVLSADHLIQDSVGFRQTIEKGRKPAEEGRLVTFGIVPTCPETGYGYIETNEKPNQNKLKDLPIVRFIEKPNKEKAKEFIADGRFTWNSGIFLFKASAILSELERLAPDIVSSCRSALENETTDMEFVRLEREAFTNCPNLPIDVAVMENTKLGSVLPLNAGWSDVGCWAALWETAKKDPLGNVSLGRIITEQTSNCYLRSEHRLVVGIGLENLIIVETDDAILIAHKDKSQDVKTIVKQLEKDRSPEGKAHRKIYRPWGYYTSVVEDSRWQVKRIVVNPGESLSLQMHHHRAEHWVVVKGTAMVERDSEQQLLGENESTYIPLGCKHRLTNPGKVPMELIEIQSGTYLGEDDIVRFEDRYQRINKISLK